MTEYAIYKSRGDSWVELYRCADRDDTEVRFTEFLSGKTFKTFDIKDHEVSCTTFDGTTYTFSEEVEGWS